MAGQISQYGEAQALEAILRKTQSPAADASGLWLLLCTTEPAPTVLTVAGITGEFAATGYARQRIPVGSASAAVPSVIANSGTITFGPFTAGTGAALAAWAIVDAVSGTAANVVAKGPLTNTRTPATGDSLQAAAGAFTVSLN
jgi:hypothetical protein